MGKYQALNELKSYSQSLLREAGSTAASIAPTVPGRTWRERWRSPQVALASLGFLVFGNIGMAAASNSAVPGDLLYPVDRAFESVAGLVGVDVGGPTERLEEAAVLIGRGQFEAAIGPIAAAVADLDDEATAAIETLGAHLARIEPGAGNREALHSATFALLATVRGAAESGPADVTAWRQAVADCVDDVADTASGQPSTPPGQDDTFVPPGQDDGSTPPGQEDKDKDKDKDVPPGLEDKDKDVPPVQEIAPLPSEESTTQDGDDGFVPPGQDDDFTPPGKDKDKPKGRGNGN